jgi:hypothetical protein
MHWSGYLFAGLLAVSLGFAAIPRERGATLACWTMLFAGWVVSVLTTPLAPNFMLLAPAMDVIFGVLVLVLTDRTPRPWLLALAFCFLTQSCFHAVFWAWGYENARLYHYQLALNIVLALQILCVSAPGGRDVARRLLHLLFPVPRIRGRVEVSRDR